jgi:protein SCO1
MLGVARSRWTACLVMLAALFVVAPIAAWAQPMPPTMPKGTPSDGTLPTALEDIGIEDKSGVMVPLDITLQSASGDPFKLGQRLDGEKPLVIVLAYYGCPMLCSLVLNGLVEGMKDAKQSTGEDYRVLVVSFDPRDDQKIAKEKRDNYAIAYGRKVTAENFDFATGSEAEVSRLSAALGFRYRWDDKTNQYAHAAGAFVVTPKGKLSQTLTGITFPASEFDAALTEASRGVSHSPLKSVLLYCFSYDAMSGSYVPIVRNIMKVGAGITVLALAFFVFRLFRSKARSLPDASYAQRSTTP